jgi:hypothetical protein
LSIGSLKSSEIVINAVQDSLDVSELSKTTPKDLFNAWEVKATPIATDKLVIIDSEDSDELKVVTGVPLTMLTQGGATDGQAIVWNDADGKWEAGTVEGSKWTEVANGIYRDGRVAIGTTTVGTSYLLDVVGATRIEGDLRSESAGNLGLKISTRPFANGGGTIEQYTTANNRYATTTFYNSANVLAGSYGYGDSNVAETALRDVFTIGARTAAGKLVFIRSNDAIPIGTFFSTGNFLIQNGGTHSDAGFRLDVNGTTRLGGVLTLIAGGNIVLPTTTGVKIGTATNQLLSFWNATPIQQPTTAIAEATFVENSGGVNVNDDSTFDGYTIRQVVKALRNEGLLA